jgi:hypothetical protein
MPDIDSIFATVEDCQPVRSLDLSEGITGTIFKVVAKIDTPTGQYSNDIYLVKILEPARSNDFVPEMGATMEHGRFDFDTTEKIPQGTKLKISISPSHD